MLRSDNRILVTHAGSLPRSERLSSLLIQREQGKAIDRNALDDEIETSLDRVVKGQLESGIDIGNSGEQPRVSFVTYVPQRMSGFAGESRVNTPLDLDRFPKYAESYLKKFAGAAVDGPTAMSSEQSKIFNAPQAVSEVKYDEAMTGVTEELDAFERSVGRQVGIGRFVETFITAAPPGGVATVMLRAENNPHYPTDRDYILAVAKELKKEFDTIVSRGHILQIDAPDLAMERQMMFKNRPLDEFLDRVELHVEALNLALRDIPPERVRLHVCWGNWDGPHSDDVDLEPLLSRLYEANVGALSIPFANPRHQHEYKLFRRYPLPDSMILIPGLIDVTTNYLEHPEVVADRICAIVDVVGDRSRVIAGCDCGFGTFTNYSFVAEDVCWAKLSSLSEGAAIASRRLWG